ncbi:glycosyltransferase family 2 protein [Novilysobacter antarcticus]|uniref:glycosyltransferase family 2 protein n=1 Tax=Novilysobacter antarcticus TaxID=2862543 RepID=UPI001C9909E8|nr:glycosyltransferase family 2 protein [Lysobacter antarcticus]
MLSDPALVAKVTGTGAAPPVSLASPIVAVIIPSYRVTAHILDVIARIGAECHHIIVVDDCCPDGSGDFVEAHCSDARVAVLRNERNLGVGGAVMAGYRAAMSSGADILIKIDGDGQMAPELISRFIHPITHNLADYTKGNRFYDLRQVSAMPAARLFGNAVLSFMSKFSTGYWDIFDPTNGYTALHARVAANLPLERISNRYFFESDILFRLNTLRAVVVDIPMAARYADEVSNLRISKVFAEFLRGHLRNFSKRILYNYFLRDLSAASMQLVTGACLLAFGSIYGLIGWHDSSSSGVATPPGTVMLAALPVLVGIQLLLGFLASDMQSVPKTPIHPLLFDPQKDRPDVLRENQHS